MEPIIHIKNIGKKYDIMHQQGGYVALRDVLTNTLRRPFSFAKHKVKEIAGITSKEEFWALKNISFDVRPGEVIGIIGKNGSGKSTLLKILTGITPPTEGEITMRGRIASLLEVGTGFHPELTGRENIFLNGAILGMSQKEIARQFDNIVAFSGVEKFLDTPVKRYSSGMYVRLAFSVAAHMEPDILLIDEVLAVGDAEFQKKCLGKMEEVTSQDGRTILFVSHNMSAIRSLCKKVVLMENGVVKMFGDTETVINHYLEQSQAPASITPHKSAKELTVNRITSTNKSPDPWIFQYGQDIELEVELESYADIKHFQLGIGFRLSNNEPLATVHNEERSLPKGVHTIQVRITNPFTPGAYGLTLDVLNMFYLPNFTTVQIAQNAASELAHRPYNTGVIDLPVSFTFN